MSQVYQRLIKAGNPSGEVVQSNRFLVEVLGLFGAALGSEVVFANGALGLITRIEDDIVRVNVLTSEAVPLGTGAVIAKQSFAIHPSEALLGRVVDPLLRPLDDGPAILSRIQQPVFAPAPGFAQRYQLDEQCETGVAVVDTLFPIVNGQRIAIMGDTKSGKTSFALQAAMHQAKKQKIIVMVLIAKRKTEIATIIHRLKQSDTLKHMVLVVADSFASLPLTDLAPYSGCAIAEFFWQNGKDTIIIYDDLLSHAKVHREIALLANTPPGRESYPGDMFFAHSSLLERAGRLSHNLATLTALPLMTTVNNDITGYLSTNIISITDGQLVFDTEELQRGTIPPINTGLSVSRIGGRAQSVNHKNLAQNTFRALAAYRQSSQFASFGQDLPDQYRDALRLGQRLKLAFNQGPDESYSLIEQQILLTIVFMAEDQAIDMSRVKDAVRAAAPRFKPEMSFQTVAGTILKQLAGKVPVS